MDDSGARYLGMNGRRSRRGFGVRLAFAVLLASLGLLAAACGGGSKGPASGSGTATTTAPSGSSGSGSSGPSTQSEELRLAQCMRSHGVPNFPDPSSTGGLLNAVSAAGINTRSSTYQAALGACKKYGPAGHVSPAQSAADNTKGLEYSRCMRSHGVPNFPDPVNGPTGGQAINLHGTGIDLSSPAFQAAHSACQKIIPSGK